MKLVVDANVLLAAFLKEATTRELLLDSRLLLFAPEHLITEISQHLKRSASLRKRISLSSEELQSLFETLTYHVQTFSKKNYLHHMDEALRFAAHHEDAHYLALALHLKIPIWSNDKCFMRQNMVQIYSTSDLIRQLAV